MRDIFVRRIYSKYGINVLVELDFLKKTVSIVNRSGQPKEWIFANRTPEYLASWIKILKAVEYAVAEAKKEMDALEEEQLDAFMKAYANLDQKLKSPKVKLK